MKNIITMIMFTLFAAIVIQLFVWMILYPLV